MNTCPTCGSPTLKGAADERGVEIIFCEVCSKVLNLSDFVRIENPKKKKKTLDSILGKQ